MTIRQALDTLDSAKFNTLPREEKIRWLSVLDMQAAAFLQEFADQAQAFPGYDAQTDLDTVLLIEPPYADVYLYWLEARIDYHNCEYNRFNNANAMYEALWKQFTDHCIRTRTPRSKGIFH